MNTGCNPRYTIGQRLLHQPRGITGVVTGFYGGPDAGLMVRVTFDTPITVPAGPGYPQHKVLTHMAPVHEFSAADAPPTSPIPPELMPALQRVSKALGNPPQLDAFDDETAEAALLRLAAEELERVNVDTLMTSSNTAVAADWVKDAAADLAGRLDTGSMRVHKYPLPMDEWVTISMPQGAEPLDVQVQRGLPCLWARVDVSKPVVAHHFRVAGTGHDLGSNVGRHIGSFQLDEGRLVLHVFAERGAR